jgi:hypothetical protein
VGQLARQTRCVAACIAGFRRAKLLRAQPLPVRLVIKEETCALRLPVFKLLQRACVRGWLVWLSLPAASRQLPGSHV